MSRSANSKHNFIVPEICKQVSGRGTPFMKTICAHCSVELSSDRTQADDLLSHGLCRPCLDNVMAGSGHSLESYLNRFNVPVFVVDANYCIVSANDQGQVLAVHDLEEIRGDLTGDVFGCLHADDPDGCGESLHCRTCTIRNTIKQVIETGDPCLHQLACQDLDTVIGPRSVSFIISAEKAGDSVLLKIDEANFASEIEGF